MAWVDFLQEVCSAAEILELEFSSGEKLSSLFGLLDSMENSSTSMFEKFSFENGKWWVTRSKDSLKPPSRRIPRLVGPYKGDL